VRKQQEKTSKFNVALKVDCQAMKEVWDTRVSLKENMTKMGVAFDANNVVPKISSKMKMVKEMKKKKGMEVDDNEEEGMMRKSEVIARLEDEAKFEAKQTFRFTPTQVQLISYMMDKHGEDWSAMARDPKNHYQETAAKLRGMVTKFISIPEHYAVYCRERGFIQASTKPEEEANEDVEEEANEDVEEDFMDDEVEEDEADALLESNSVDKEGDL